MATALALAPALLSRRRLLLGSGLALAAFAARARAEDAPDTTVLHATKDGFNGAVPGPVIRVRRGDEVKVRLVNDLGEPLALRWHGVRAPSAIDGARPVAPGASFDYRFTVPDAGTFWYRAALRAQQDMGLYGALIVSEPTPPPADQDLVLMFHGRRPGSDPAPALTIDGATAHDIAVRANERLRLRFINASATQAMDARIENHRAIVMALDGEPAEPFASRDGAVWLGPGNRADIFVDATLAPGATAPVSFALDGGEPLAVPLVYGDTPARSAPLGAPAPLPPNPLPERMNFSRALRVALPLEAGAGESRSGAAPARPPQALFMAERGRTVVMALDNRDAAAHVVYLHGHHFRLLDRLDDGWKPYWLDTIAVAGHQTVRIAFVADNPGRWLVEHRPAGGTAVAEHWFEVK
jgi:FtsP/CotA-like multicopper oxidase with cupredoxin domain